MRLIQSLVQAQVTVTALRRVAAFGRSPADVGDEDAAVLARRNAALAKARAARAEKLAAARAITPDKNAADRR